MFYQLYELNHAFLSPARAFNDVLRLYYKNPLNPLSHTDFGKQIAAAGDVFERLTRRYGKPEFGLAETEVDGQKVAVAEEIVWERPFCRLVHFRRALPAGTPRQANLVIVAPMSGHYATLLRGTVQAMLPHHEVYITDWTDARMVPLAMGRFDLDDYIDYVTDIVRHFGGDVHLMAVCQPAVPVFAATALMEADGGVHARSLTLMGGPIDTRQNPTEVNTFAAKHDIDWFRRNVIQPVPFPNPGMMRQVYPGFLQLTGFMTMNLDRHLSAHYDYFDHLVKGDGEPAEKHREFYDEYLSVMDLTAEFYLQTVDTVFLRCALPRGLMRHRNRLVDPRRIRETAIFTVEGENDDISGTGQTRASHALTPNLPAERHQHYEQAGVGHYGVFNGSRFRREIAPRITAWIDRWDSRAAYVEARVASPVAVDPAGEAAVEAVVGIAAAPLAAAAALADGIAAAPLFRAAAPSRAAAAGFALPPHGPIAAVVSRGEVRGAPPARLAPAARDAAATEAPPAAVAPEPISVVAIGAAVAPELISIAGTEGPHSSSVAHEPTSAAAVEPLGATPAPEPVGAAAEPDPATASISASAALLGAADDAATSERADAGGPAISEAFQTSADAEPAAHNPLDLAAATEATSAGSPALPEPIGVPDERASPAATGTAADEGSIAAPSVYGAVAPEPIAAPDETAAAAAMGAAAGDGGLVAPSVNDAAASEAESAPAEATLDSAIVVAAGDPDAAVGVADAGWSDDGTGSGEAAADIAPGTRPHPFARRKGGGGPSRRGQSRPA